MDVLRTPDERFADLADFPYEPKYAEVPDPDSTDGGTLRMAYVDHAAGEHGDGEPVLLLHGEPTWSYLYRKMIPILADAGMRVIAPDLVGFGRSDKPTRIEDHTYARHVEWLRALAFDVLDLRELTLVGQDWGGLLGLRLVAEHPDRFKRYVAANTGLPTGDHNMPEIWWQFRNAITSAKEIDIARFVQSGCQHELTQQEKDAYDAPFPDESYKAAARAMPPLVPTRPDDPASDANRKAWKTLTELDRPALIAFSDGDPITGAMGPILRKALPRTSEHPIPGAGHFLQDDRGPELAQAIVEFVRANP